MAYDRFAGYEDGDEVDIDVLPVQGFQFFTYSGDNSYFGIDDTNATSTYKFDSNFSTSVATTTSTRFIQRIVECIIPMYLLAMSAILFIFGLIISLFVYLWTRFKHSERKRFTGSLTMTCLMMLLCQLLAIFVPCMAQINLQSTLITAVNYVGVTSGVMFGVLFAIEIRNFTLHCLYDKYIHLHKWLAASIWIICGLLCLPIIASQCFVKAGYANSAECAQTSSKLLKYYEMSLLVLNVILPSAITIHCSIVSVVTTICSKKRPKTVGIGSTIIKMSCFTLAFVTVWTPRTVWAVLKIKQEFYFTTMVNENMGYIWLLIAIFGSVIINMIFHFTVTESDADNKSFKNKNIELKQRAVEVRSDVESQRSFLV